MGQFLPPALHKKPEPEPPVFRPATNRCRDAIRAEPQPKEFLLRQRVGEASRQPSVVRRIGVQGVRGRRAASQTKTQVRLHGAIRKFFGKALD
jgi:hypothetical protein